MARLMRAKDWSRTSLGNPADWPQSLKVAVGILLTSRFEMWLGWGKDVAFLYNDAYRPTLGIKHPDSLAKPTEELWAEIWEDVEPRIRKVYEEGEATWDRALLLILERSGVPEETYHTFSYSPILGDNGETEGLLCAVSEETLRVIAERRMETLRDLSSRLAGATDRQSVLEAARLALSGNMLDLPFTLTYLGSDRSTPAITTGLDADHPLLRDESLSSISRNSAQDIRHLPHLPNGGWDRPPVNAIAVPLVGQGGEAELGAMVVGLNPLRPFDHDYTGFLNLIAGQIAAGLAGADVYESERRRSTALAEALRMRQDAAAVLERANSRLSSEVDQRTGERDRLRALFQNAPSFMCVLNGPEHVFEFMNGSYLQLVGQRDLIGKPIREALPDVGGQGYFELLDEVYRTAKPFIGRDMPVSVVRQPGAMPEERYLRRPYRRSTYQGSD